MQHDDDHAYDRSLVDRGRIIFARPAYPPTRGVTDMRSKVAMTVAEMDCIYPDCLIATEFGKACEHSCPHEASKRAEARKLIADLTIAVLADAIHRVQKARRENP
jgi:hypothetical protein